jgi:ribosome-associated translation inhibitor RaiA
MSIRIQSIDFKADQELTDFVNEKVGKLFTMTNDIIRADVALFLESKGNLENKSCRIQLVIPGNDHIVEKNSTSFEASVMECVEALLKIIRRAKD